MEAQIVTRKNQIYTVIEVPSDSNPAVVYRVDVTNLRCSCPAWKFQKTRKLCKHLTRMGFTAPVAPSATGVMVNGVEVL
jgi:hypothetical protein